MKDLGKTKFCLVLQLDHLLTGILVYQSTYVQKILEKLNMDKAYLSKTPMVVRVLEKKTNPFRPHQEGEEVLSSEYPYLSAIRALMYLTNNTRPDITFVLNLLVRYNATPTIRRWN
jgi:NurA-like 5'-3' nuclease